MAVFCYLQFTVWINSKAPSTEYQFSDAENWFFNKRQAKQLTFLSYVNIWRYANQMKLAQLTLKSWNNWI